jgi:hypothetical protein
MRIAQHLVKSAFVLLIGCATVEFGHAQSDVTKTFVDRLIEQVTKLDRSCAKEDQEVLLDGHAGRRARDLLHAGA